MKEPLIKANRVFKYSITFQETNQESREVSDFSDSGFIIENETDEIGDILKLAQQTYGIYYPISFGAWESTTPEHNAKYFEKGIETYYALFIENEDGTAITEEEYDFITFLLSDGNYNKSEFTDYAVGGVVLGALALGVGGLIAYYYFNKRKKGYPTGSAWTKEHYHDNEDEDYEVEPSKRKVPARNRKYVNGGEINEEEIPTPQELLYDEVKKLNQDEYVTFCNIYGIDEKDKNKMIEFIDSLSDKDAYEIIYDLNVEDYADGGEIEVVGKGNKGAFRKREYEGMTEKEVIQWWEQRGYKLSKTKSESSLKPYTFYINKFVNGGGVSKEHLIYHSENKQKVQEYLKNKKYREQYREDFDDIFDLKIIEVPYKTFTDYRVIATKKYSDGGGVDDYDYEDIGQFSMPDSEWKNYSQEDFNRIGRKIVKEQFNGDLTRAYDSIVHKRTYFVVSAKNDKVVSRGFNTEEEAKKEMYSMFEKTGDFSYAIKKFVNGGTTTTRPTTTPEVVPDTDIKPRKPKTPFQPKHIPKPKARKYDFILIKK